MRILLLVLCGIIWANAADYYISPTGDDGAAGTSIGSPWRTVTKVNGLALVAGDRVLFEGGRTFTDAGLRLDSGDTGTAADPIIIGSYGDGRATLQPPSGQEGVLIQDTGGVTIRDLVIIGPGLAASDSNTKDGLLATVTTGSLRKTGVRLERLDISGYFHGIYVRASGSVGFEGMVIDGCLAHHNVSEGIISSGTARNSHIGLQILNSEVSYNLGDPTLSNPSAQHSGSGILLGHVTNGLVDRCYAHHNGGGSNDNAGGGPVGIWTYYCDGVVIQRSLVHDQRTTSGSTDGGGFDFDGGSINCIVQYCYSYGNEGAGFLVAEFAGALPLSNCTYRYNVSWRDGRRRVQASGFEFWSGASTSQNLQNIHIYNNLVYTENTTGSECVGLLSGPMANIFLRNNIFVVQGGERFVDIATTTPFIFQNNIYHATDGNFAGGWKWGGATYTSLSAWRAATGSPETAAGLPAGAQIDPLIADLSAGAAPTSIAEMEAMTAFKLLVGSPAKDAGKDLRTAAYGSLDVGTRDFWGNAIPLGAGFDIGPHEAPAAAAGSLQFGAATYSQAEGNSGSATVTITVTRTGGSSGAVGVTYATSNGTAMSGSDYTAASGTLSWADGDAANKTFAVTIAGDTAFESDETVNLALSSATGGASLGTSSAVLTIANDDAAPAGTLAFSSATYSQAEGNSGSATVTITVTRTGGSSGAVGVTYATSNGTAMSGSDYTAASGALSWADGDAANKTFAVTIAGDTTFESDETVNLALSGATGGASLGTSSAVLTIANDDVSVPADVVTVHAGRPDGGCGSGGGLGLLSICLLPIAAIRRRVG